MELEMTLTVLGCGTMGIAILSGIPNSLDTPQVPNPILTPSGTSNPAYLTEPPTCFPSKFIATLDGAVAIGLPRAEAQKMAAQTMRGIDGLVLLGEHPALLRDTVSTPGGCTIGGLLVLEERRVRGTVARAVRKATVVAGQLGKGVVGFKGTRL
ncbi:hypothetical protein BHYA_0183g00080 [Botrytis hyacinthi]|uniref:Pyrroline-5-carboxylate reductase dimerisation domain-containing protein n=1 Tax=Botrytis hyacinthi TaxID=278943 RepID=A0A4Z1GCQ4_9HELO|nr:hypothetical protein BHYA_0183g00080 [Botrytis hyacinthi]